MHTDHLSIKMKQLLSQESQFNLCYIAALVSVTTFNTVNTFKYKTIELKVHVVHIPYRAKGKWTPDHHSQTVAKAESRQLSRMSFYAVK